MLTDFIQLNMNVSNTGGNASAGGQVFVQSSQDNKSSFDTNDFIAVLIAMLSGFNNAATHTDNTLSTNKHGQHFGSNDTTGQSVEPKNLAMNSLSSLDANLINTIQQVMSSVLSEQAVGMSQPVNINMNQSLVNINEECSMANMQTNSLLSLMQKTEDGMLKVKIHTNEKDKGESLLQIKVMAKADNLQFDELQSFNRSASTTLHDGTALKNVLSLKQDLFQDSSSGALTSQGAVKDEITVKLNQLKLISPSPHNEGNGNDLKIPVKAVIVGMENQEIAMRTVDVQKDMDISSKKIPYIDNNINNMSAHITQTRQTANVNSDNAVTETVHVNRLNELGEAMSKTLNAGEKHLTIKLEPPDLGNIQIKLRIDNGMLRADFRVDSSAVKDLFSAAMPQIKASLEDSGIKVSDFFVDVKEDYYSDSRRQQDDNHQQKNKQRKDSEYKFFDYFA